MSDRYKYDHAYTTAEVAHDGVFRKFGDDEGKPYIIHPERVAVLAGKLADYVYVGHSKLIWEVKQVAIVHDVPEDRPDLWSVESLSDKLEFLPWQRVALDLVTKKEGEDYCSFILRLIGDSSFDCHNEKYLTADRVIGARMGAIVKIADITDNLMSLEKGSMRDKYMISRELIIRAFQFDSKQFRDTLKEYER